MIPLLKPVSSSLRKIVARHGKACAAAACGSLSVIALAGLWSLASAQQPYPAPYPEPNQTPYPQPGYQQPQAPPPGYDRAYRQPQAPPPGYDQAYRQQGNRPTEQQVRCMQLEQELANDWVARQQGLNEGPKLEEQIRKVDRIFQSTQAKAERQGCYQSNFIFGRSLVRTPKCLRLHQTIEDARRQLENLQAQRQAQSGGRDRRRSELVAALARAGCGSQYQQEARRSSGGGFFSWLEEDFWDTRPRRDLETSRIEQFATYRTLCVRSCDGYYFPVSFSTLPSNFTADTSKCQSQCAAPSELFVYRNPGEEPEQMVSADGRQAYGDHPNAWRYRKEYVKGCSCKAVEYDPNEIALANEKAEAEKNEKTGGGAQPQGGGAQYTDSKNQQKPTP